MVPSVRTIHQLVAGAILTAVYVVSGKLGLTMAFVHASASAVWPPTGIALAAFLLLGYRVWPAIFLGAFLVNITTAGTVATSLGIAGGNTLEGLLGAYLVNRFANGRRAFDRPTDLFRFVVLAAMGSTVVSATCGVTTLELGGFARWASYGSIWMTWWLGDVVGALTVAPMLVLWSERRPEPRKTPQERAEVAALFAGLVGVGLLVFGGLLHYSAPIGFVCIPPMVWAAYRFGQREAATASCLLSAIAVWGTLQGLGPFVRPSPNASLLLLQAFMGVVTVTALTLAAVVSERRRAEALLRQREGELSDFFENATMAMHWAGPDGTILWANQAELDLLGYPREDYIGRNVAEFHDDPKIIADIFQRLARKETIQSYPARLRCRNGALKYVLINENALWRDSDFIHTRCFTRDITDQKLAERLVRDNRRLIDEIAERQRAEAQLLQAQKFEVIGQLAAGIAHEINTPIQYVNNNLGFLHQIFSRLDRLLAGCHQLLTAAKQGTVPPELTARVETLMGEAEVDYLREEVPKAVAQSLEGVARVAKIVRSVREMSHPGAPGRKIPLDLNKTLESALTMARNEWTLVAEVVTDFDPALPPVPCLEDVLHQALLNLLINAAQAVGEVVQGTNRKGIITVRTRRQGDWAQLEIHDTGLGIPQAVQPKIFEPFFTTKDVGRGTGQGLAIAHASIVRQHGGSLWFETREGRGTTFFIRLPLRPPQQDASTAQPAGGAAVLPVTERGEAR